MASRFDGPVFNQFAFAVRAWVLLGDEGDCRNDSPEGVERAHRWAGTPFPLTASESFVRPP
jgi:hypothetical protein